MRSDKEASLVSPWEAQNQSFPPYSNAEDQPRGPRGERNPLVLSPVGCIVSFASAMPPLTPNARNLILVRR